MDLAPHPRYYQTHCEHWSLGGKQLKKRTSLHKLYTKFKKLKLRVVKLDTNRTIKNRTKKKKKKKKEQQTNNQPPPKPPAKKKKKKKKKK